MKVCCRNDNTFFGERGTQVSDLWFEVCGFGFRVTDVRQHQLQTRNLKPETITHLRVQPG